MTENPTTTTTTAPKRLSGGRIALLVSGALTTLLAVGVLGLGALALWGEGEKDERGYLSTDSERFAASTHALASGNVELDFEGAQELLDYTSLGDVRLEAAPEGDKPLFVGIARTNDVQSYLRGVAHTAVTDLDVEPFEGDLRPEHDYRLEAGGREPARPASKRIWAASSQGRGPRTLTWEAEEGDWSVVVMNADGSAGVEADIAAGAKVPYLSEIGWSALGSGTLLALVAGGLILLGARPPRNRPGAPAAAGLAPAAG